MRMINSIIRWRKNNKIGHVVNVITSCNRKEQLQAAETYALLAGLRLDPIVNEALNTMKLKFTGL